METLKNHVKELRGSMGMTQGELAELVGVTRQTIISLEKGSYVPSLLLAMKLSEALQSPMEEIFFKETIL
ncbi:helix-turn-helix transcriptional regulator [Oscillibacter sp.]|uniref:helix-turn-helix transcriptional regulator n=1 Tax=Oscillibacter sp. TaxID=1945593 RepID=UPI002898D995|nr:helix-turn-helix transcriptional regulator [Oscillibacter sp.]